MIPIIKNEKPKTTQSNINEVIKKNNMKSNNEFSDYNFRNKKHKEEYLRSGKIPAGTPSLYNIKAVEFIISSLNNEE